MEENVSVYQNAVTISGKLMNIERIGVPYQVEKPKVTGTVAESHPTTNGLQPNCLVTGYAAGIFRRVGKTVKMPSLCYSPGIITESQRAKVTGNKAYIYLITTEGEKERFKHDTDETDGSDMMNIPNKEPLNSYSTSPTETTCSIDLIEESQCPLCDSRFDRGIPIQQSFIIDEKKLTYT
ncbi:hypothetical protein KUTeg_007918 [Tegillarca granosa]|uniref:Uncharacterized protein n=1 Tax=Tegillarca granosa TaxID=220873 RepID=A0ABQ9FEJ9_TEGGR|nr:hypothetical protein KUTeg_007918 [Tegillarca granosa]